MPGDQQGEERKALIDQVLEVAVYVPLGAALKVAEQVPELAATGRSVAGRQIDNARMIGRVAVEAARRSVGTRMGRTGTPVEPGATSTAPEPPRAEPVEREATPPAHHEAAAPPAGSELAVAGYDTLAASQIVPLLAGLSGAEIEEIRRHEEATRRRRTVLGRIAQLQAERHHGA
ncbi:MAG: hypothetical protein M0014_06655 [Actinomycetota bacterium]|jgi:hypothetical protein|nr:hypothetical protein [Actinomycetota bacterium]